MTLQYKNHSEKIHGNVVTSLKNYYADVYFLQIQPLLKNKKIRRRKTIQNITFILLDSFSNDLKQKIQNKNEYAIQFFANMDKIFFKDHQELKIYKINREPIITKTLYYNKIYNT